MFDRERLGAGAYLPPWVHDEHLARYRFASQFVRDKRVLDAACGDGTGSNIFAEAGATRVDGFDLSSESLDQARTKYSHSNLIFHVASVLELPVSNGSADVFISLETIEHLNDDRAFLDEVRRVLRPDGVFICSTPNRRVTNPGRSLGDPPWNRFHVREYSMTEFQGLLAERFAEVELHGQNPRSLRRTEMMELIAGVVPGQAPARMNQVLKLPRFLLRHPERHGVVNIRPGLEYEYAVAVCRAPRS